VLHYLSLSITFFRRSLQFFSLRSENGPRISQLLSLKFQFSALKQRGDEQP
jgi:hypothetical protein